MKKVLMVIIFFLGTALGWATSGPYKLFRNRLADESQTEKKDMPYDKYAIENLAKEEIPLGKITIKDVINVDDKVASYLFEFEFNPNLDGKTLKKVTGQINFPKNAHELAVILMFRGYIDKKLYRTGDGTRNAANYFAEHGFITVAPDFLGYGGSDSEAENIFETRFQTYVTALSLLKYFENSSELKLEIGNWEYDNLFIWGHSNGGQIALTLLEVSGVNYPATLWAPVSKFFPYSVLYYTVDSEDRGKLIRSELSIFEKDYDANLYSLDLYLDRIQAPLQIHQGTKDNAVPKDWSDDLVLKLKSKGKDATYYEYPGTDHNMRPSWNIIIARDLEFFKKYLPEK